MGTATRQREWKGLALLLLASAQFVIILDAGIVNIAMPSLGTELGFQPEGLAWVTNAYTVMFGGLLLLGGRIADLTSPRRVFMVGMGVLAVASLVGGFAPSAGWLIAARAGQGLGAALISPSALALVMTTFAAGSERNRALGVFMSMSGLGGACGFLFGGVLTQWFGWPAVFFVNVPVAVLAIALAPRLLGETRNAAGSRAFDTAGAVSVTAGLALLVYTIVSAGSAGWASAQTLGLGAVAIGLLVAFTVIESRHPQPLVPLTIFRNRTLSGANVVAILLTMSVYPFFFFLTLYLQQVRGFTPFEAGIGQLPVALAMTVTAAGLASTLVTRFGPATVLGGGLLLVAAGLGLMTRITAEGSYWVEVAGPCVLIGVGAGCTFVAVTVAATASARASESGLAAGLINTTQQFGGAIGLAVLVAIASTAGMQVDASGPELLPGYRAALFAGAVFAMIGAVLTAVVLRGGRAKGAAPGEGAAQDAPAERG
ncbi:DHA2 family efflux MFS transporter permease subunit [Nocardiopsis rhodophaea]|uniref:DHA2 family efflux MFS transporter permease subunit n=1 Tax=Nocardiopsis rhodophaea TaxID=280238 RepID=A0ABN2SGY3_9ACTN